MKAYKASYNGVCRDFKYEVGQTYEMEDISICHHGFHACLKMIDTLFYYDYKKEFVLFEVELLGEIIEEDNKLVTNKIKIVRVVSPEEYVDFKVDDRGNLIYHKSSDGYEWWREFDERNNEIYSKYSSGYEWWREYDLNDNCIHYKNSHGYEYNYRYDINNKYIGHD